MSLLLTLILKYNVTNLFMSHMVGLSWLNFLVENHYESIRIFKCLFPYVSKLIFSLYANFILVST